jgi:hypothetical protein
MLYRVFGFLLGCFGFSVVVGSLWIFFLVSLVFFALYVFASFCILLVYSRAPTSFIKFLLLIKLKAIPF